MSHNSLKDLNMIQIWLLQETKSKFIKSNDYNGLMDYVVKYSLPLKEFLSDEEIQKISSDNTLKEKHKEFISKKLNKQVNFIVDKRAQGKGDILKTYDDLASANNKTISSNANSKVTSQGNLIEKTFKEIFNKLDTLKEILDIHDDKLKNFDSKITGQDTLLKELSAKLDTYELSNSTIYKKLNDLETEVKNLNDKIANIGTNIDLNTSNSNNKINSSIILEKLKKKQSMNP